MYTKALALAALAVSPALAAEYSVNIYWGQKTGPSLASVCESDGFEYITLGFLNNSPEQDPSGLNYPGSNFAGNCAASVYGKNGVSSKLQDQCTAVSSGIAACHAKGKKVLLSIGGQAGNGTNYTVSSPAAGRDFADFLWGAYGPVDPSWTGPRPFGSNVVDGFDFDIEVKFDDQSGYIALIDRLHDRINGAGGSQVISGAPQCPLNPDFFDMDQMISQAQFDLLWIQFYNNPACDYIVGNAFPEGFNFNAWQSHLAGTASSAAKLFIGLPGDATPSSAGSGYVDPAAAYQLMQDAKGQPSFGGAMVWDAYTGGANVLPNGRNYFENLHDALNNIVVPVPTTTITSVAPTATAGCTQVTVQGGEYCWLIATNNKLSLDQLLQLNPGLDCDKLQPGDRLIISGVCPVTTSTTSTSSTSTTTSTSSALTTSETSTSTSETSTSIAADPTTSTSTSVEADPTTSTSTSVLADSSAVTTTSVSIGFGDDTTTASAASTTLAGTAPLTTGSSGNSATLSAPYGNSTTTTFAGTAPLKTGSSSTSAIISAPYGNTTSTSDPTSSVSLVDPTSTQPPYGNSTTQLGSPSSTVDRVITGSASLTTSTISSTTTYTITSCPATVPNCPLGSVTTETVIIGTTVCPVVDVTATVVPVTTTSAGSSGSGSGSGEWTTSTVYTTTVYTVTACPSSVPNCPGRGSVTTEVVPAYTTVCPVTQAGNGSPSKPTTVGGELGFPKPTGGIKQEGGSSTTTTRITSVAYTFVTVPSKGPSAGLPAPSNSGNSSLVVTYTVKPTGGSTTVLPTGSAPATKPTKPVTAGAGRAGVALGMAGLFAAGVMLL